jgi:hypothetical protein
MDPPVVRPILPDQYLKVQLAASWKVALAVQRIGSRKLGTRSTRHLPRSTRDVARAGRHASAPGALRRFEFRPPYHPTFSVT